MHLCKLIQILYVAVQGLVWLNLWSTVSFSLDKGHFPEKIDLEKFFFRTFPIFSMYQEICPKSNMICPLIYKIIWITATVRKNFFHWSEKIFPKSSSYLNDFVYKRTNHIWFRTNFSVHGKNRKCAEKKTFPLLSYQICSVLVIRLSF